MKIIQKIKNIDFKIKISIIILIIISIWILTGILSGNKAIESQTKKGGGELTLLAKNLEPSNVYKVVSGYGRIDRGQIIVTSEINSQVIDIKTREGAKVSKKTKVIELLHGVLVPAPIEGTLDKIDVKIGDTVFAGQTKLFSVISSTKLDAILNISALETRFVKVGQDANIVFENQELKGKVDFVSQASDRQTNTFEVKIKLNQSNVNLFQDETVRIAINTIQKKGVFVPTSAISINNKNELLLTLINGEDLAVKIPVEMLETKKDGVWVAGDFKGLNIVIIRGADFVRDGEKATYKIEN
jgi:multidrug efflux pump subunit AcrA (membrane-fusion protein)